MKNKLFHQLNYPPGGLSPERPVGVSQTVPDQTPNFHTMLARGQAYELPGYGYSDEDYPDLHQMDTMDIMQMRIDNAHHIDELRELEHRFAKELEERHKPVTGDKPITSLDSNRLDDTQPTAKRANTPRKSPSDGVDEEQSEA